MRFDFTSREAHILVDALAMPMGVAKVDRGLADQLREKMKAQLGAPSPPTQKSTGFIRSHWPENHLLPTKKQRAPKAPKVSLPKSTTPAKKTLTVENILNGLL